MISETLSCARCGKEYDILYSFKNDEEIVSQTRCGCVKQSHNIKPLDRAFEVLNEELKSSLSKVSRQSKTN